MANDRLYLRCTKCGDYILLGKWYPSFSHCTIDRPDKPEQMADFINRHIESCLEPVGDFGECPIPLTFDSEHTLMEAGGKGPAGGTGNIERDKLS